MTQPSTANPLLETSTNTLELPPFHLIKTEHFLPAFHEAILLHNNEIERITNNHQRPTFENTIEALEYSGRTLANTTAIFFNLNGVETNEEMEEIATEISPILTEHEDNILLNEKLFDRIRKIYRQRIVLSLSAEQRKLLEKYYTSFVRNGAKLNTKKKEKLKQVNKELSLAELAFEQNVLAETNAYKKLVEDKNELKGIPQSICNAASEEAKAIGENGKWLFTTHKASLIPVLKFSENRSLRKELLHAYTNRGNNNNEHDNKAIIKQIIQLRIEKARLLGFRTPAEFSLDETMAKKPQNVFRFLNKIWKSSLLKAIDEKKELQQVMDSEKKNETLETYDWWYYSEKLRKEKYALDEEETKPFFELEKVRMGAFQLATKLWGLQFRKISDAPIYHHDVEVFEVTDKDGSLIGNLYTDYFPRPGKRAGAWMDNLRPQYIQNGVNYRPIIINVGNFTKPTSSTPSLLSMEEVETLFHEFGHALHGLLSQCHYPSLSGTNVARDFVELPSQLMENWCFEPEVLKLYAFHYQTGQLIPDSIVQKIQNSKQFNIGFTMTELLAAAQLDMHLHTITDTTNFDITCFEQKIATQINLIPEIGFRYNGTYFNHIFGGMYEAGYYSYTWAEVLDADAYHAFSSSGDLFNPNIASAYRHYILEKGGTVEPMKLYKKFRGKKPNPQYLLQRKGFIEL